MSSFLVAYSKLLSLKENLPEDLDIEEYYVEQYHAIVDSLREFLGEEVDEFRIGQSEIGPIVTVTNYVTHETRHSDDRYCDRPKFLTQLDALINYLTLQSSGEDKKKIIGFRAGTGEED